MQILLSFFLLFFLNFAEVKAASLEILVKQQKIALPYLLYKGKKQRGGVVIINGEQGNEGVKFVEILGEELAKNGWSVAFLNADTDDKTPWIEQLPEALSSLRQQANQRLIVIHYGSQLERSVGYFSKLQSKRVNGMIFLSAFNQSDNQDMPGLIRKMPFPLFDITGQFDYDPVLQQAAIRQIQTKNGRYLYRQLPGASHDYLYNRKILVANIHGWMKRLNSTDRVRPPIKHEKPSMTSLH